VVTADPLGLRAMAPPAVLAEEGRLRMFVEGEPKNSRGLRIYQLVPRAEPDAPNGGDAAPPGAPRDGGAGDR
jgi:hypothetical protein